MTTLYLYRDNSWNSILIYDFNPSKPLITNFSYYFNNIEEYKNTFKSFEHQEFNKRPYTKNDWMFRSHYLVKKFISNLGGYDEPYWCWKYLTWW